MRDPIGDAVQCIRAGGLVAYPTETVWGLGADATAEAAVAALRGWKGRDVDAPMSLLVTDIDALEALGFTVGAAARELAGAFWPGPLTLVLPCRARFASGIANPHGGVGVRCSSHPLAGALARRCAEEGVGPITATSLNRSGSPPAKVRAEAEAIVAGDPDALQLLDVETADAGGDLETTVLNLVGDRPAVLRWGSIGKEALEPILLEITPA
jgi:L-threonylcarbamoyladenylate synthase